MYATKQLGHAQRMIETTDVRASETTINSPNRKQQTQAVIICTTQMLIKNRTYCSTSNPQL